MEIFHRNHKLEKKIGSTNFRKYQLWKIILDIICILDIFYPSGTFECLPLAFVDPLSACYFGSQHRRNVFTVIIIIII